MKTTIFFIFIILVRPCIAQELISFKKADSSAEIKLNQNIWDEYLQKNNNQNIDYYFKELDFSGLGNKDIISVIENKNVCGMRSCPMRIISNRNVIFEGFIPMEKDIISIGKKRRGFYPDIFMNGIKISYHYDEKKYKNFIDISNSEKLNQDSCKECFKEVPKNPVTSPSFNDFVKEIEYETNSFNSDKGIGKYKLSKMALIRIGLVEKDDIFENTNLKWTSSAKALGINSTDDFIKSPKIQEHVFKKYILYIHNIVKKGKYFIKICEPIKDIYNREGNKDYWGILKGAYMFGFSIIGDRIKYYDGTDKNKQILDGSALKNNCIKKIITGSIIDENMLLVPKNKIRGLIE